MTGSPETAGGEIPPSGGGRLFLKARFAAKQTEQSARLIRFLCHFFSNSRVTTIEPHRDGSARPGSLFAQRPGRVERQWVISTRLPMPNRRLKRSPVHLDSRCDRVSKGCGCYMQSESPRRLERPVHRPSNPRCIRPRTP